MRLRVREHVYSIRFDYRSSSPNNDTLQRDEPFASVCVAGAGLLTVEFSVRLVRAGESLLMVQVSVGEACGRPPKVRERPRTPDLYFFFFALM